MGPTSIHVSPAVVRRFGYRVVDNRHIILNILAVYNPVALQD